MFFSGRTPKKKAIVGYLRMRNTAFERFNPVPKLRIREDILKVYTSSIGIIGSLTLLLEVK
jgi:hypothetical protein